MNGVRTEIRPDHLRLTGMRTLAICLLCGSLGFGTRALAQSAGAPAPAPAPAAPAAPIANPAPAAAPNAAPEAPDQSTNPDSTPPPASTPPASGGEAAQAPAAPDAAPAPQPAPSPAPELPSGPSAPAPPQSAPAAQPAPAAQQPPTRSAYEERPAAETEAEDRRGESLYVRIAAGIGFPFGPDITDEYDGREQGELRFSGYAFSVEVMGGSAVLPWLVLGLGVSSEHVVSGTIRDDAQDERDLEDSLYFAVIGGFADLYTSPPAGLHFQALLGLSHLSRSDDLGLNTANGFGAVLGVGYELAIDRRWNLGVLGRIAFSSLSMDDVGDQKPSPSMYEPSLLWTATFRPEA